jgi:predicted permease
MLAENPFMIERFRSDLVTAIRSLLSTPMTVGAAILTLAIAAGVNLAMFGLIGRALVSPAAHVVDAEQIYTLGFGRPDDPPNAGAMTTTSFPTFAAIRDQVHAATDVAAFQRSATTAVIEGEQRQVNAMIVSGGYFDLLGARPYVGRGIVSADDRSGAAEPVAVLSYAFWRSAFGGDRGVIGRHVSVRGLDYVVSGVMPDGFSGHSATDVDLWMPFASAMRNSPDWDRQGFNILSVIVRVPKTASVDIDAVRAEAESATTRRVTLTGVSGGDVGPTERRIAWWLGGVSLLVLVIGLANAGTLLVVRATKRRGEAAIRAALGASRGQLIAHATVEALLLSCIATVVSLVITPSLDEAVRRVLFPTVVSSGALRSSTVVAALVAGLLAAIVAAAANIWQLPLQSRPWQLADPGRTGSRRTRTLTSLLLVQTTVSVLLLAGAAMFGTSLYKLAAQDFGMQMNGVVLVQFEPGPGGAGRGQIFKDVLERVRNIPGVQMATFIDAIPFGGFNVPPIAVPGRAEPPNVGGQLPRLTAATPEYLKILGIDVVEGRTLTTADDRGEPVVLINQAMARGTWPGESAIGKCIRIGFDPDFDPQFAAGPPTPSEKVPCRRIVGVTRDVRQRSLLPVDNETRLMEYYVPYAQVPKPPFAEQDGPPVRGLMLRTTLSAGVLATPLRRLIVGGRTDLPFLQVQPYASLLDRQMRPWTLATTLLVWFSALALGVAAVGLYASFAHLVAERRREMAIRLAIGAEPGGVLLMILRESMTLAGIGVICGSVAAVVGGRWIQSLLFATTPSDPIVLVSAAMVMLVVAAGATLLPARTASKVDPNTLLRVN